MAIPSKVLCVILITLAVAGVRSEAGSIAIYWGQNSNEGSLADACATDNYKFVLVAFLPTFGNNQMPMINLADQCDPYSNGCTGMSADVKSCQRCGVKVLLSIGGGTESYYLANS